ncbi:hypothetical protein EYS14_03445 [Alteromonadaceae bacterium M269]|nr:hypothetical protein EYS14_03445 [Alteromonadaceae bacterium M269]
MIPVKGFGESEGKGADQKCTDFEALDGEAIALGGLWKEYIHSKTGEVITTCSVITLGQAEWLKPYHTTASPLMLPDNDNTRQMWLDSSFKDRDAFDDLLQPQLVQDLIATPIDKPTKYNPIGESIVLKKGS